MVLVSVFELFHLASYPAAPSILLQMARSHPFLPYDKHARVYRHVRLLYLIHPSVDGHLGCFHVMAVVNDAAVNIGRRASFQISVFIFVFFAQIPCSGITGSNGESIFDFLKSLHTFSHSGCASLHSHQQCLRFLCLHSLGNPCYFLSFLF